MSIIELVAGAQPPLNRAAVAVTEWSDMEREIGTPLPSDYKAVVDQYGLGKLDDFIVVFTPYDENPHINLGIQIRRRLDALEQLASEWDEEQPYSL